MHGDIAAAAGVLVTLDLISITMSTFHFWPPAMLDIGLTLTVHVTNPNVVPAQYGTSAISILHGGAQVGTARLDTGGHTSTCSTSRLGSTP
jgi:hypothetical protein